MSESAPPQNPWDLLPPVPPKLTWSERWRPSRQMHLEQPGDITWRRHWWYLVKRMIGPVIYFVAGSVVALAARLLFAQVMSLPRWLPLTLLFVVAPAALWAWWEQAVWRGDIYTLTDERIIDIERRPLGLGEKSRGSPLDRIQDIDVDIPNVLARLLNMGNVQIKTGAAGSDLTFLGVPDPYSVQYDIWHRLAKLRRKLDEQQRSQRFQEMIRWFAEYDNLPPKERAWGGEGETISG
jgi:membrane protein YdbS with pleckstrin-like domain